MVDQIVDIGRLPCTVLGNSCGYIDFMRSLIREEQLEAAPNSTRIVREFSEFAIMVRVTEERLPPASISFESPIHFGPTRRETCACTL